MLGPALRTRFSSLVAGIAAGLLLAARLCAGEPAATAGPMSFNVDVWSTEEHLPQSSVIAMTQTRDGYLWLGTMNGLVRFDGSSFTIFNVNNTTNLPSDKIVFLYEDRETNLWVGTLDAGLCVIRNGLLARVTLPPGQGRVKFADEDESGTVWFCTDSGQFFSARNGTVNAHPGTSPVKLYYRVFHLQVPGVGGDRWMLQNGQVKKYHGDLLVRDYGASPWTNSPVPARFLQPDGSYVQVPFDQNVTAATVDKEGNLVVGTPGYGIYWFGPDGTSHHITVREGLSHDFILSLCSDQEGSIWVGTDTGGIDRLRRRVFQSPAGLAEGAAQSISEDAQGGLWTTFTFRGLAYYLTNTIQTFTIDPGLHASAVLADRDGNVWAGTSGEGAQGLFRLDAGRFQPVSGAGVAGAQIHALFQGRDGKLWVGGQNGLGCFDGEQWSLFDQRTGLPPGAVRAVAEDAAGNLWVASGNGALSVFTAGRFVPADVPLQDISCLLAGADGVLWAGTSGHGLLWRAGGRWQHCSSFNGLAADDIGYLVEDEATNLWIGTYEGLVRVAERSLFDSAADPAKKVSGRIFLTRECSSGIQPAAIQAHDGKLWFPTVQGVVTVAPAELTANPRPPPVVIESIAVDGVPQEPSALSSVWPESITLAAEAEQLAIHFTSLNFSAPKNAQSGVRFRWRLGKGDQSGGWTEVAGGERVAHFNRLSPGEYHFQVKACNEDGFWNEAGAALTIQVLPPFWQTRPFIATVALVLLGLLAGAVYLVSTAKLKRQVRALHQKELIEKERARIARDLHDQLGANLTQVTLLGEMAEADKEQPGEVEQHAQQICATARDTARSLDEIVWAVNPSNDTLEGLANYACKYAQDYFALAGVSFRSELPTGLPAKPIPPEVRHNVFLAFKEAVNNVVKHAQATEARVKLQLEPGRFILSVTDNGRGLGDISGKQLRNGMRNMNRRLADVHGEFEIASGPQGGTVVQLKVPIGK